MKTGRICRREIRDQARFILTERQIESVAPLITKSNALMGAVSYRKQVVDLNHHSTRELFALFVAALNELKNRGVTRSTNNPIADYAELLFQHALGLKLNVKSTKGHDAIDGNGLKYEIKGRRVTAHNSSRQLSSLRALDKKHFDLLGGVIFKEDFSVLKACLVPHEQVLKCATYSTHTNGWKFHLRDNVWELPGVIDVTAKLHLAEKVHDYPSVQKIVANERFEGDA